MLWACLASALIAAGSAWLTVSQTVAPEFARLEELIRSRPVPATTVPAVQIVKIEPRPLTSSYPSAIVSRRRSPVFAVVTRSAVLAKNAEDRLVSPDREIGSAVSVTADGWFVAPASLLSGTRAAELGLVVDGRVRPVEKAVRDSATDVLFLKITAQDLPLSAFVQTSDVAAGITVWLEPRSQRLYPSTVTDIRLAAMTDAASSERAIRRFLVTGEGEDRWPGAAVWDADGRLVGMVEAKIRGGWRVLPAGNAANALSSLLATQEIRHASLGVRSLDLSAMVVEGERAPLLPQGAWIRSERKTGLPAVAAQGPSAGVLQDGDVIERVERDILDGTSDLGEHILTYRPGTSVTLSVSRKGNILDLPVTLGSLLASEWILK